MSKFIGIIVGVVEVGVGIVTGNVALIVSGALMLASSAAALLLAPKSNTPTRQAAALTLQLGEVPRAAIFGETAIAGSLVDAANWGGTYGTDWEGQLRALADHYCEGLTGFFVNDTFVTFAGDGPVSGYNGQLEVYFRHGDAVQTLPSIVTTNFPGWSATDYGAGVCYVVFAYKADAPDAKNPVWPGGRPQFLPVVKGKRCYDSRKDSTVPGGSGTHRWTDPTTWEWSDNLIVCRYNWARGIYAKDLVGSPDMLLVGRGLSATEQPPANMFAPANVCDELVGGQALFRCDGSVNAGQKYLDVENEFALACGGVIVSRDGAVEIEPAQAKAPTFFITDADLVVAGSKSWNEGIVSEADDSWVNTVIANYIEPTQKWQTHGAPVARVVADVIADEGPREQTLTLDLVKRQLQASNIAEFSRRLGRLWGRGQILLGPRFAEIEEGDWGQWTSARHFGGATKTFRVDGFKLDEKWQTTLTLREIASSVFGSVTPGVDGSGSLSGTTPPALTAPASGDFALSVTSITGSGESRPALQLLGACSQSAVDAIVFEYRPYSVGLGVDDNWVPTGIESRQTTKKTITQVAGNTAYQVSIRYRVSGELSPRLILGPVSTTAWGTASAPGDGNRVRFSLFEQGVVGWAAGDDSFGLANTFSVSPLGGVNFLKATTVFTASGQSIESIGTDTNTAEFIIPVTAGERIFAAALLLLGATMPAVGTWQLNLGWLDATNTEIGSRLVIINGTGPLTTAARYGAFATAPASAVGAFFRLAIANHTGGAVSVDSSIGQPMVCSAGSSQLSFPAFSPGPDSEPGASVDATFTGPQAIVINADVTGVPKAGAFDGSYVYKLNRLGAALTSGVAWAIALPAGNITYTSSVSAGALTITFTGPTTASLSTLNKLQLTATYQNVPRIYNVTVTRADDPPTNTGGSGGGGGGTSASTTTLGNTTGTTYDTVNAVSATLTVTAGSAGQVALSAPLTFARNTTNVGSEGCFGKWQWRVVGGTFADVAAEVASITDASKDTEGSVDYGSLDGSMTKTGLTSGTPYEFRFLWRENTASGVQQRLSRVSGTLSGAGS